MMRRDVRRLLAMFALSALTSPVLAGVAFAAASRQPAPHWMTIATCNNFHVTIFVAFAYHEDRGWTSRGWLRVPPRTCKNAKLPASEFSFHADSDWYIDGDHNSRDEWGGSQRFCVSEGPSAFAYHPAAGPCDGGRLAKFSTTLSTDGDIRLTFRADGRGTQVKFL